MLLGVFFFVGSVKSFCLALDMKCSAPTIVVKLGGASITKKSEFETIDYDSLVKSATSLAAVIAKQPHNYIVVHGAGSYGHHQAKKFNLRGCFDSPPPPSSPSQLPGVCATRLSVQKLNLLVVEALINAGLKAVSISPMNLSVLCGEGTNSMARMISLVTDCVVRGYVPVIHGDACFTKAIPGAGIVSGDPMCEVLAKHFCKSNNPNDCAIFVTDVPGIFPKCPKKFQVDNELIREIIVDERGQIVSKMNINTAVVDEYDVTGGILSKIDSAVQIARAGVPVHIVEGNTEELFRCASGEQFVGTTILRST